jgi:hypothetical protein
MCVRDEVELVRGCRASLGELPRVNDGIPSTSEEFLQAGETLDVAGVLKIAWTTGGCVFDIIYPVADADTMHTAVHQSSHFIQAHALLNLHIIHSSETPQLNDPNKPNHADDDARSSPTAHAGRDPSAATHGGLGPGFNIYSPLRGAPRNPHANGGANFGLDVPGQQQSDFTAIQLLRVMSRLTHPGVRSLPYFTLCREFGVKAIDGMVRGRILDLRWTEPVTREGHVEQVLGGMSARASRVVSPPLTSEGGLSPTVRAGNGTANFNPIGVHVGASSSGTVIMSESGEGGFVPISEREAMSLGVGAGAGVGVGVAGGTAGGPRMSTASRPGYTTYPSQPEEEEEVIGPKVMPASPILRYAMREVVAEYEDTRSVSDYASMVDVDEY